MEIKSSKIAIIAGNGSIPFYLIKECIKQKREYCLIIIDGHGKKLSEKFKPDFIVSLAKMGKAINFVNDLKVKDIVMVGSVTRPSLNKLLPDLWTAKLIAKISTKIGGDDTILSSLTKALEYEGFNIIAPEDILPSLLCPEGTLGVYKPNENNMNDIIKGCKIAKIIGLNDIGQSIVIENGHVLAVEAAEGTDNMIKRSKVLKKEEKGGVLVKVIKPQQDRRIDRPVIGIDTIKTAWEAGLDGLALENNEILILNINEVIKYANEKGLFIEGI